MNGLEAVRAFYEAARSFVTRVAILQAEGQALDDAITNAGTEGSVAVRAAIPLVFAGLGANVDVAVMRVDADGEITVLDKEGDCACAKCRPPVH